MVKPTGSREAKTLLGEPVKDAHGMLVLRTFDGTFWRFERWRPEGHVCQTCNNTRREQVGAEPMWNTCTRCSEYTTGGAGLPPWEEPLAHTKSSVWFVPVQLSAETIAEAEVRAVLAAGGEELQCKCGHQRKEHRYIMTGGFLGCGGDQHTCACSGFTAAKSSQQ